MLRYTLSEVWEGSLSCVPNFSLEFNLVRTRFQAMHATMVNESLILTGQRHYKVVFLIIFIILNRRGGSRMVNYMESCFVEPSPQQCSCIQDGQEVDQPCGSES